jgi:formylglycine-generating enzyme required for sulfatase activity
MRVCRQAAVLLITVAIASQAPAQTQRDLRLEIEGQRRARVIGNNAYARGKLVNAVNDARLMSATLHKLDFQVDIAADVTLRQLEESVNRFTAGLSKGDVAIFYYAGHGVQIDGENYLIPIDFAGKDQSDIKYGARSASWILDKIVRAGAVLQIVILDACRTNPFRVSRDVAGGGLAQMQGARGSFIAFATAAGKVANDDPSASNGLFTSRLAQALTQPGLSLDEVFNRVRVAVDQASGGEQLPYIYSGVIGEFYFTPPAATANATPVKLPPPVAPSPPANTIPAPPATYKDNPRDGQRYVWIPPGTFTMGCSPGDICPFTEKPAHQVTISRGFWIGQTEVTQEAYQRVKRSNPSETKGSKLPVESVTWFDAQSFCQAIGMRLPTEAEWEYAARAGTTAGFYGELDAIAWVGANSGNKDHDVGQKQANAWGVYDSIGSVTEWVADWYSGQYPAGVQVDPQGPAGGTARVVRGPSRYQTSNLRVSFRNFLQPDGELNAIGFRCAGN